MDPDYIVEHDLWCPRCKAFRIIFGMFVDLGEAWVSCVFCRGPLVPVTPEIIAEYPNAE